MQVTYVELLSHGENTVKKHLPMGELCTSTFNYYIKYVNESCHFVGHSKMKPIDYNVFL